MANGISQAKRIKLLKKYGPICFYCGEPLKRNWQVDHKVPKSLYGTDRLFNLAPSCVQCNMAKYNLTITDFINLIKKIYKRIPILINEENVRQTEEMKL